MAGIGFELKKIFKEKGVLNNIRGYFYTTIVIIGPFILIMTILIFIQLMLKFLDKSYHFRELFTISVVYSFIFSQIVSSGFAMLITRFAADKLYTREYQDILPSFFATAAMALCIGFFSSVIFFWHSPLELEIKIATYILYMELIIMWLIMVYLSALKDYRKIFKSFGAGSVLACILAFLVVVLEPINIILGLLIAMDISVLITVSLLIINVKRFFKEDGKEYLLFLDWFDRLPSLFFINLFYTTSLYIHNIIIWFSPLGRHIAGTYIYAPLYDVPTFYAFLSIIPTMTIFVVFVEVNFYEKYKKYFALITGKGNYFEIKSAYLEMANVLWHELANLIELQLVFTFLAMIAGNLLLPKIGMTYYSLSLFNILTLGAYLTSIALVIMIFLLYFEDRKGALAIAFLFLLTNVSFNIISVKFFGPEIYGFGFFLSAFIVLVAGLLRIKYFIDRLDYYIFCSQPIFQNKVM